MLMTIVQMLLRAFWCVMSFWFGMFALGVHADVPAWRLVLGLGLILFGSRLLQRILDA